MAIPRNPQDIRNVDEEGRLPNIAEFDANQGFPHTFLTQFQEQCERISNTFHQGIVKLDTFCSNKKPIIFGAIIILSFYHVINGGVRNFYINKKQAYSNLLIGTVYYTVMLKLMQPNDLWFKMSRNHSRWSYIAFLFFSQIYMNLARGSHDYIAPAFTIGFAMTEAKDVINVIATEETVGNKFKRALSVLTPSIIGGLMTVPSSQDSMNHWVKKVGIATLLFSQFVLSLEKFKNPASLALHDVRRVSIGPSAIVFATIASPLLYICSQDQEKSILVLGSLISFVYTYLLGTSGNGTGHKIPDFILNLSSLLLLYSPVLLSSLLFITTASMDASHSGHFDMGALLLWCITIGNHLAYNVLDRPYAPFEMNHPLFKMQAMKFYLGQ